jgi:hypothetical protein
MQGFNSLNKRNTPFKSISSKDESDLLIRTYMPSMFMVKIEIHMHNILFALLFSLLKGLENTNLLNYYDEKFDFGVTKQSKG